jgi:hypothetical protein
METSTVSDKSYDESIPFPDINASVCTQILLQADNAIQGSTQRPIESIVRTPDFLMMASSQLPPTMGLQFAVDRVPITSFVQPSDSLERQTLSDNAYRHVGQTPAAMSSRAKKPRE